MINVQKNGSIFECVFKNDPFPFFFSNGVLYFAIIIVKHEETFIEKAKIYGNMHTNVDTLVVVCNCALCVYHGVSSGIITHSTHAYRIFFDFSLVMLSFTLFYTLNTEYIDVFVHSFRSTAFFFASLLFCFIAPHTYICLCYNVALQFYKWFETEKCLWRLNHTETFSTRNLNSTNETTTKTKFRERMNKAHEKIEILCVNEMFKHILLLFLDENEWIQFYVSFVLALMSHRLYHTVIYTHRLTNHSRSYSL